MAFLQSHSAKQIIQMFLGVLIAVYSALLSFLAIPAVPAEAVLFALTAVSIAAVWCFASTAHLVQACEFRVKTALRKPRHFTRELLSFVNDPLVL